MSVTVFLDADEITAEAFAIDVTRGRALEGDVFNPGGGTIRVRNYDANFNPSFLVETFALLLESGDNLLQENGERILLEAGNGSGTGTYGDIALGRKVTVKDGAVTVFTGYVEDFDYSYGVDNRSEATLTVRDGLGALGASAMQEWDVDEQLTGARVSAVLDDAWVDFPTGAANRSIATGTQPLAADTIPFNTNVLQYLQTVNRSEYGRLFVDASGKLTFSDRYSVFGRTTSATFSDDGTNLPFSDLQVRFGTELLHFRVSVKRKQPVVDDEQTLPAPVTRTATNDALAAGYPNLGMRSLAISDVLYATDDYSLGLANLLLSRFARFSAQISAITVPLGRLSTSDRATVVGLDIGDVIEVQWQPYGTTGQVTQIVAIEAVTYSFRASQRPGDGKTVDAFVSFQLSDASDPDYFVVNTDSVNGPKSLAP